MLATSSAKPTLPTIEDLLFSSRAAWVWDAEKQAALWANPQARLQMGETGAIARLLPSATRKRLGRIASYKRKTGLYIEPLTLPGYMREPVRCEISPLQLADGRAGLMICANPDGAREKKPKKSGNSATKREQKKPSKKIAVSLYPRGDEKQDQPVLPLTAAEMERFKALGRHIRSECGPAKISSTQPSATGRSLHSREPNINAGSALRASFEAAFDLVLTVSADLTVKAGRGRLLRHMGMTSKQLAGMQLTALTLVEEQGRFKKFLTSSLASKKLLNHWFLLQCKNKPPLPCRCFVFPAVAGSGGTDGEKLVAIAAAAIPGRIIQLAKRKCMMSPSCTV